ncbi:MAG: hypothetical protein LQ339_004392 [Xanthoria mediterranea]|nr:MAG: hypothetical protein LQ339_004392 [Xanthoria mediterranea]
MRRASSVSLLHSWSCSPLLLATAYAQSNAVYSGSNTLPTTASSSTSLPNLGGDVLPTAGVSYLSLNSTKTLYTRTSSGEIENLGTTIALANASAISIFASASSSPTSSTSVTLLQGSSRPTPAANGTATANSTSTTTSTSDQPTNTQPCNNYPEFCDRKYSNITQVAAHNSPFIAPNNAASNQALGVIQQLNDGIRMLQGQTHLVNGTVYYCHTSCDLLNAGTAESYYTDIARWVQRHPYDIVTLLIGNGDLIEVGNFTAPLESSGLARYAYIPPEVPMAIDDWPTLSEMILRQKRVVIFMDYEADQTAVPYVLDEFSQMWETPFSPTNRSFPCTQERPPDLSRKDAQQRLYMANHNLNTELTLAGNSLLVATVSLLNETNSVSGFGSLGAMARDCNERWARPPNFLLVDFYNVGSGSVFEVAAEHNNVTYDRPCCGMVPSFGSKRSCSHLMLAGMFGITILFLSA